MAGYIDKYLVDGEKIKYRVEGNASSMVCTDRRLIQVSSNEYDYLDIDFSHIASVQWGFSSKPIYLIFAGLSAIVGLLMLDDGGIVALIIAGVLFYFYMSSMKNGLLINTEKDVFPFSFKGAQSKDIVTKISKIIREE